MAYKRHRGVFRRTAFRADPPRKKDRHPVRSGHIRAGNNGTVSFSCGMQNAELLRYIQKRADNYTEPQRGLLARLFHSDAQIHRRGTEKCRCMQALPRQCRKNGAYRRAVRRLGERLIRFGADLSDNHIWSIIHFPAENLPIMYTHTPNGTKLPAPNILSVLQKAGC